MSGSASESNVSDSSINYNKFTNWTHFPESRIRLVIPPIANTDDRWKSELIGTPSKPSPEGSPLIVVNSDNIDNDDEVAWYVFNTVPNTLKVNEILKHPAADAYALNTKVKSFYTDILPIHKTPQPGSRVMVLEFMPREPKSKFVRNAADYWGPDLNIYSNPSGYIEAKLSSPDFDELQNIFKTQGGGRRKTRQTRKQRTRQTRKQDKLFRKKK